jgi:hypothetical protein
MVLVGIEVGIEVGWWLIVGRAVGWNDTVGCMLMVGRDDGKDVDGWNDIVGLEVVGELDVGCMLILGIEVG